MNIAYISADFGVPIFGYKGASVHVREMIAALHKAGHAVCVISPAMEPRTHECLFLCHQRRIICSCAKSSKGWTRFLA